MNVIKEKNFSGSLQSVLEEISEKCNKCGLCSKDCEFLKFYGLPKDIAGSYDINSKEGCLMPFECSLCNLCSAVCPQGLNPKNMFLGMRRELNRLEKINYNVYSRILNYEKRGISKKYSCYLIPENCNTVFFPGCALSGTRSGKTYDLYERLKKGIPNLGIVLDCCTKPSHDLGRSGFFNEKFGELKSCLAQRGIVEVIVACPNCYKIFSEYGDTIKVKTAYEVIEKNNLSEPNNLTGSVNVHDPCGVRFNNKAYNAVRNIIRKSGLTVVETVHCKEKSFCCGEGGSVNYVNRRFVGKWVRKIEEEITESKVITYCAGCENFLKPHVPAVHLIDLISEPENLLAGKVKVTRSPFTYLNRLKLKRRLIKNSVPSEISERNNTRSRHKNSKIFTWLRVLISLVLLAVLVLAADPVKIKQSVSGFNGSCLPLVFGLIALSVFISALKWKVLLDAQNNRIGLIRLFRIYVISLFFNNFLPSSIGGDGVRIYLAGKHYNRTSSAAASVVVERAIATISLSLLGLAGFLFSVKPLVIAVWPLTIVLIAGIALTLTLLTGWTPGFIKKRKGRIRDSWVAFSTAAGELKNEQSALLVNLVLSLAFQISVAMVAAAVTRGLGLPVPGMADMFFITSASSVFAMIPAGINGYGLRECAYVMLLQPYGFSSSHALTISVLFALFVSIFSLAGGLDWAISKQRDNKSLENSEVTI